MGDKLQLPGGHHAILKDPMEITERQARAVQRKFVELGRKMRGPGQANDDVVLTPDPTRAPAVEDDADGMSDEKLDLVEEFEHYIIAYFIESWDFDFKPTGVNLYDLPRPVYNKLDEATEPLIAELVPAMKKKREGDSPTRP